MQRRFRRAHTNVREVAVRITVSLVLFVALSLVSPASAKELRGGRDWTQSVVLLEQVLEDGTVGPIGTAFVVSYDSRSFIVTNRRLVERRGLVVTVMLTSRPGTPLRYSVEDVARSTGHPWSLAPDADIAVIPLQLPDEARQFADSLDLVPAEVDDFESWEFLREGDDVYLVGFPVFLGGGGYTRPIVRSGTVALKERAGEFLVDATALPGGGGGPVFLKLYAPETRTGKLATGRASSMVGIASTYVSFAEQALSARTGRAKVVSEENAGLVVVHSADRIVALLRDYVDRYGFDAKEER
jgi:hypothetical protein